MVAEDIKSLICLIPEFIIASALPVTWLFRSILNQEVAGGTEELERMVGLITWLKADSLKKVPCWLVVRTDLK